MTHSNDKFPVCLNRVYVPQSGMTPLGKVTQLWARSPTLGFRERLGNKGFPNRFKKRKNNMVVKPVWIKNLFFMIL